MKHLHKTTNWPRLRGGVAAAWQPDGVDLRGRVQELGPPEAWPAEAGWTGAVLKPRHRDGIDGDHGVPSRFAASRGIPSLAVRAAELELPGCRDSRCGAAETKDSNRVAGLCSGGRGRPTFLAGLSFVEGPAQPIYLLVAPFLAFVFGPTVFAVRLPAWTAARRAHARAIPTACEAPADGCDDQQSRACGPECGAPQSDKLPRDCNHDSSARSKSRDNTSAAPPRVGQSRPMAWLCLAELTGDFPRVGNWPASESRG